MIRFALVTLFFCGLGSALPAPAQEAIAVGRSLPLTGPLVSYGTAKKIGGGKVDFTDPYQKSAMTFVVPKDSTLTDFSPAAMAGKTIGAVGPNLYSQGFVS